MDCIAQCKSYIDRIVGHKYLRKDSNVGKVILLDAYTTQVVSNVYSQTEILGKEVYLIEHLGTAHEAMPHMKAAVFVRPTPENIDLLARELGAPKYKEYHIFFSNVVHRGPNPENDLLRRLADADEQDLVKQVQEFYGDFIAVNEDLFTLSIPNSLFLRAWPIAKGHDPGGELAGAFAQSVQGVLSVLLSMKAEPSQIRFQKSSQV
jgi:vacuolar protein sorting-associated protein 45